MAESLYSSTTLKTRKTLLGCHHHDVVTNLLFNLSICRLIVKYRKQRQVFQEYVGPHSVFAYLLQCPNILSSPTVNDTVIYKGTMPHTPVTQHFRRVTYVIVVFI